MVFYFTTWGTIFWTFCWKKQVSSMIRTHDMTKKTGKKGTKKGRKLKITKFSNLKKNPCFFYHFVSNCLWYSYNIISILHHPPFYVFLLWRITYWNRDVCLSVCPLVCPCGNRKVFGVITFASFGRFWQIWYRWKGLDVGLLSIN